MQAAVAESLIRLGRAETALPVLESVLAGDGFYALHAANALYRSGSAARPLLPAMKRRLAETTAAPVNSAPFYVNRILVRVVAVLEGREQPLVYPQQYQP